MSARALPLFALFLTFSPFSLLAGCGDDGPECVIDTDCELGFRCAADQTCQPVGAATDAGSTDAGARDAAVADAGAMDAGVEDAGAEDASVDDGGEADAGDAVDGGTMAEPIPDPPPAS